MTVFDASVLVDALVVAGPAGDKARMALRDCSVVQTAQYPFEPFVDRGWELRHNLSSLRYPVQRSGDSR